jgi:FKBP12-rapamycin complex-associated protein
MRNLSVELLKESPSPALRACHTLAQLQPHVARELFAAGFISCWSELQDTYQEQLVRSLEAAFASPTIPPEIIATLLNLAEFMEHDEKPLPVDIRTLGALAEKCRAYAKALHYKEQEFQQQPSATVEALISINNQLQQPEAAVGILLYSQQHLQVELKESWYEKLHRWDEALEAYQRKRAAASEAGGGVTSSSINFALGEMRCLHALAEWEPLVRLSQHLWPLVDTQTRMQMAPLASHAAWNMRSWDHMGVYVSHMDPNGMVATSLSGATGGTAGVVRSPYRHTCDTALLPMVCFLPKGY